MKLDSPKQHPADWLRAEYARRRKINAQYSLRAFARFLELPSGRLTELLQQKRQFTDALGEKISCKLALGPDQANLFFEQIANQRASKKRHPLGPSGSPLAGKGPRYNQISSDAFYAIADWEHYAILSLFQTNGFQSDPAWIADRLGISSPEAQAALSRLERLGLVDLAKKKWRLCQTNLTTTHDIPSSAIRRSHKQSLEQSIQAIEEISIEFRDITSMTMAINMKKIQEAKHLIRNFRRELSKLLETGLKTEVYNLNIQLVPVTKLRH